MSIFRKALDKSGAVLTVRQSVKVPAKKDREVSAMDRAINSSYAKANSNTHTSLQRVCKSSDTHSISHKLKSLGMLITDGTTGELADVYRKIKRPLLANSFGESALEDGKSNLILITSSLMGEGKTFTALNLALSIALEKDNTVLLVDMDVTKQDLTKMLGFAERKGLIDVLDSDELDLSEVLIRTDISNLGFLPTGKRHEYVTELLSSKKMSSLIEDMSIRYPDRVIIFDSPPLMVAPQSYVLADLVGQIVLVVKSGETPQLVVKEALESLGEEKVIGTILNKYRRFPKRYYKHTYH